jgi:hypothetical protein
MVDGKKRPIRCSYGEPNAEGVRVFKGQWDGFKVYGRIDPDKSEVAVWVEKVVTVEDRAREIAMQIVEEMKLKGRL